MAHVAGKGTGVLAATRYWLARAIGGGS
jgi:hypothetical protein